MQYMMFEAHDLASYKGTASENEVCLENHVVEVVLQRKIQIDIVRVYIYAVALQNSNKDVATK